MAALRILVVDDEPANREVAGVILSKLGHEVVLLENGAEALERCIEQGERFDLILMDILMPVLDGLEATRRLRAHNPTKDLPIVCVSARASGSDKEAGMAAGCDYYLTKPYRRQDLIQALIDTIGPDAVPSQRST
jgi:CheY-like chemotaxis protein